MHSLVKGQSFLTTQQKIPILHLHRSFQSSVEAYAKLIGRYARDQVPHRGKVLHAHLITTGLACLTQIATKLMSFYVECGDLSRARMVFAEMPERSISRWVVIIGAYARHGYYRQTMDAFSEMQRKGLKPDRYLIPSVLKATGNLGDHQNGKKIHCVVLKFSFEHDAFVASALVDMYWKCGNIEKARSVFDHTVEKDIVVVNAMVSGYAHGGFGKEALSLVKEIRGLGINPDIITWNALLAAFSSAGDTEMVLKIFRAMHEDGVEPDVVSWTSVISGLVQNFRNFEAFCAFKQMLTHRICPNSDTISSLLPACASVANLKWGKEIHCYSVVIGVEPDVYVRTALVDMYAKCGFLSEARWLFHNMPEKNTVTCNSMIFGYANNGRCHEAIELFVKMVKNRMKLNHLTFTGVLMACAHAGLVDLGKRLFLEIQKHYEILPRVEHYACMVDLLGRAGSLLEAYNMIKKMPMEADIFVWGALLGACSIHGNMELAQVAAKHLAELEPHNAGNHLLLSSLYARNGSWENVASLKKTVKRKHFSKFPSCSWIEIV